MASEKSNTGTNTVTAIFSSYGTARQASRELEEIGIPPTAILIESMQKSQAAGSVASQKEHRRESSSSGWQNVFNTAQDEEKRTGFDSSFSSGKAVLRATVPTTRIESAAAILNRCGAADTDRWSTSLRQASPARGTPRRSVRGPATPSGSGTLTMNTEESSPAWQFGFRNAGESRYQGRSWEESEGDLRFDYERSNPGSTWEKVKNEVRSGWNKLTGQH